MDLLPIPYFGMIMALFVAPLMTFGFIAVLRKMRTDVDKLRLRKEILELELRKEELRIAAMHEENKKYDRLIESKIADAGSAG